MLAKLKIITVCTTRFCYLEQILSVNKFFFRTTNIHFPLVSFNCNFSNYNTLCLSDLALSYRRHTDKHFINFTNNRYVDIITTESLISFTFEIFPSINKLPRIIPNDKNAGIGGNFCINISLLQLQFCHVTSPLTHISIKW